MTEPNDWTGTPTTAILVAMEEAERLFSTSTFQNLKLDGIAELYNSAEEELIKRGHYNK